MLRPCNFLGDFEGTEPEQLLLRGLMKMRTAFFLLVGIVANLLSPTSSQLDFGESLESEKCSFANFQTRVDEVRLHKSCAPLPAARPPRG